MASLGGPTLKKIVSNLQLALNVRVFVSFSGKWKIFFLDVAFFYVVPSLGLFFTTFYGADAKTTKFFFLWRTSIDIIIVRPMMTIYTEETVDSSH